MRNKKIKILIAQSYTNSILNPKKVFAIAKTLLRAELKKYIAELKNNENRNKIMVITPFERTGNNSMFADLFPGKTIDSQNDKSLIIGAKIVNNDNVYEFNLRNTLNGILEQSVKNYD